MGKARLWLISVLEDLLRRLRRAAADAGPAKPAEGDLAGQLTARGWLQCDVIPVEAHGIIQQYTDEVLDLGSWVIVLTQSCDLLHHDIEGEPYAELVIGRLSSEEASGQYTGLRNPRRLQIEATEDFEPDIQAYGEIEVTAAARFRVPRQLLTQFSPDNKRRLTEDGANELIAWTAARYHRLALPTAFDKRRKPAEKKLKKLWSKLTAVGSVYLSLNDYNELPDGQVYETSLMAVMSVEQFANVDVRAEMERHVLAIGAALGECEGIVMVESEVRSAATVTLDETELFSRWYLDSYSSGDDNHEPPFTE